MLNRLQCRSARKNMAKLQNGLDSYDESLMRALNHVDREGLISSTATYASLIRSCADEKRLSDGHIIHAHLRSHGLHQHTFLANLLMQMYAKCNSAHDALHVFNNMGPRNNYSWNLMLAAYVQNSHGAQALGFYNHMQRAGISPDRYTFFSLLSASAILQSLEMGRHVHQHIAVAGLESDLALRTAIVNMYGKCHSLIDARIVFDKTETKDVVLWNSIISVYAQNRQGAEEALELFQRMRSEGVKPNRTSFARALDACANLGSLQNGRMMHKHVVINGFDSDIIVRTSLIKMYGKCGDLKDAWRVFDEMHDPDVITWNAMLVAFLRNGRGKEALKLFKRMKSKGVSPDNITFLSILDACAAIGKLETGRAIHMQIVASGFDSDIAINNALVNMYGKCGSANDARIVFDGMNAKDVISWTAMITVYAQNGHASEGLQLFRQMTLECIKPDKVTIISILDACANLGSLENGKIIHGYILASKFNLDVTINNTLINMYGKCGSVKDALLVFDKIQERDVISWNTMITVYVQNGHGKDALEFFKRMFLVGVNPDRISFLNAIDACAKLGFLEDGRMIHQVLVANEFDLEVTLSTALVNMYSKCGRLKDAVMVFDGMHERDVISWNVMIAAYAQNDHGKEALECFIKMNQEGFKPNKITFLNILDACTRTASLENGKMIHEHIVACGFDSDVAVRTALIEMYGKCGSLKDAQTLFNQVHERDIFLWTAMITAYVENGQAKQGLELFRQMNVEGIKPDRIILLCVLDACSTLASLEHGRAIHECILGSEWNLDITVNNALVNMFGKCGSLRDAEVIFSSMSEQDAISWNAMIDAYAQNGQFEDALELFRQMNLFDAEPDGITFLTILNACAHAGFLDVGWQYFISMNHYGIMPLEMHYVCMSDLIGRVGYLDQAEDFIINMPIEFSATAWANLIGACRIHGNVERGACAARKVFELDPDTSSPYSLLSNIFLAAGRFNDAAQIRKLMIKGEEKPGCG